MNPTTIKAILFDAGDTLNRPASGNWFVPIGFTEFFENELGGQNSEKVRQAFQIACGYLDKHHHIETEEQEYTQFVEFYRLFLTEYGYAPIPDDLVAGLAHNTVYNDDKFAFFEDTFTVVPQLAEHFTLGIISNTWPSLDRVFRKYNLRHYFATFIMSSVLGVYKPHIKMYTTALDELQLAPEQTVFVDDNIKNLEAAADLGMQSVLIDRYQQPVRNISFPRITNLHELKAFLNGRLENRIVSFLK